MEIILIFKKTIKEVENKKKLNLFLTDAQNHKNYTHLWGTV
jgi:hypothetical protein